MLRLIKCEFWKLKRKKFVIFIIIFAAVFPILLSLFLPPMNIDGRYGDTKAMLFDSIWQMVIGYGMVFLLPCIIGILSAMLFLMERDNETFKNIRTIPISSTQMVLAKIAVLFILAILFCLFSTLILSMITLAMPKTLAATGLFYKIFMSVTMGILITLGSIPLVLLVVFFSKNYLFSIMLAIFYTVFNFLTCFGILGLPKELIWWLPTPDIVLWSTYTLSAHMKINGASALESIIQAGLIPSTGQMLFPLCVVGICSVLLIVYLYRRRGDE